MTTIVLKKDLEERLEHLAQERRQPLPAVVSDSPERFQGAECLKR